MLKVREAPLAGDTFKDQKCRGIEMAETQVAATSKKTLLGL